MNAAVRGGPAVRLGVTIALIYALHFAPNVVRETYLAVAMAEGFTIRVDRFVGLHPDLFEIPGRGAYIDGNPGASILGAIPYAVARPAFEVLYRLRPAMVAPKPPTTYDDPRPNRTNFMNDMRARGLDMRLALAAAAIHLGLNVPLGVLAGIVLFLFLRDRLGDERTACWLSLLFAFGTPMFLRSAFLNQNLILAYCTLFAFLALVWRRDDGRGWRAAMAGALLGLGLLCDYSAAPLLLAFGVWAIASGMRQRGVAGGVRDGVLFVGGAAGPTGVLLWYQLAAFGHPFLPAQAYMPATPFSVEGWHGVQPFNPNLLWRNLFDPAYGLLVFCPMLAAAAWAPRYRRLPGGATTSELALIFGASFSLYLFASSIAFAALQWNTGPRYLVPAVPLLFLALVPVLVHARRGIRWLLVAPTLAISWCVAMSRESVPVSLRRIFTRGPELPWHTVLQKTSSAYGFGLSRPEVPVVLLLLMGAALWLIWTARQPIIRTSSGDDPASAINRVRP